MRFGSRDSLATLRRRTAGIAPGPDLPRDVVRGAAVGLGLIAIGGTLLSFRRSPHWFFRMWDFPRLQVAGTAAACGALHALLSREGRVRDRAFEAALTAVTLLQLRKIAVYTPFWPVQVERSREAGDARPRLRLLIANVQMENIDHDAVLEQVRAADPDVVLLVETDVRWERAMRPLEKLYDHVVRQPQDNYYGMMLYSRLPLAETRTVFLVEEDIPSIHAVVVLPGGRRVRLHALHPRPPQPERDRGTGPRDAELILVGRAIAREPDPQPTIVVGDLNDVAWSHTTALFLRVSGLLDPRIGRGFYNSFNARMPVFRWPLDHVFHSSHFRLVELRRLDPVGSDHFPMLIELSYEPEARRRQHQEAGKPRDRQETEDRLREGAARRTSGEPGGGGG
jgi:endonuclease/exonuclease/phosphatase (EEP) superfamily protein YafD